MTEARHATLAAGRWNQLTLVQQLANIGSEVGRAARAKSSGNESRLVPAIDRCLELFDLTLGDERWRGRRREIARAREVVCDFLVGDNLFGSSAESLDRYFLAFAVAAREGFEMMESRLEQLRAEWRAITRTPPPDVERSAEIKREADAMRR